MKRSTVLMVAVWAFACAWCLVPATSHAQNVPPAPAAMTLDAAFKDVPAYEFGKSRECLSVVSDAVRDSQKSPEQRKELVKKLVAILQGKTTTRDAKDFVCRQLSIVGTEEVVPVLAPLLGAKETADMARYALERIPGPAADKALLAALGGAAEGVKVGIVNSLGVRQCAAAVSAIAPLVQSKEAPVAEAAMAALGKIADPAAIKALAEAQSKVPPALHRPWADAYLICADKLAAKGDKDQAVKMYEQLAKAEEPVPVRLAAFVGRVNAQGAQAAALVAETLTSPDADMQAAAAQQIRKLAVNDKAVTETLAAAMPKLATPGQVLLLSALGDRGDKAALPAAVGALKSSEAPVRVAALVAAGKLGDASTVSALVQIAAKSEKDERDAARNALDMLRGNDVDAAMVTQMKSGDAGVKTEIARSLAARNATSAVPALLEQAKDADEGVRSETFKALAALASAKEFPAVVDLLAEVQGDGPRAEAEKAVVQISKTIPDEKARAAAVLAALPKTKSVPAKCSFYTVLGLIGDPNGLVPLRDAVKNGKKEEKDAAIRALAGWPTADAMDDLMKIAESSKDETHRALALRGLLKALELKSDRPMEATMSYYEKAMKAAEKPDEKKMVLAALAKVKDRRALALVQPCLSNPDLKAEAELAAQKIRTKFYKASACENSDDAKEAIDDNPESGWGTKSPQKPDMWFKLDLDQEALVSKIVLDATRSPEEFPRGYQVFVSNDENNWGAPVAEGKGSGPVTEIAFTPKAGKFIKIVQTGTAEKATWSIHEIRVTSMDVAAPAAEAKKGAGK